MNSSLTPTARICPCPNCGEMIYSDAPSCRFCSAPLDRHAAESAADNQKQVNNAVNLAKWIRNSAGAMWGFVGLGLIFGFATLGAIACMFLIPVALVIWQVQYGRLKTADPDYGKTRRDRLVSLLLWLPASTIQLLILVARGLA